MMLVKLFRRMLILFHVFVFFKRAGFGFNKVLDKGINPIPEKFRYLLKCDHHESVLKDYYQF